MAIGEERLRRRIDEITDGPSCTAAVSLQQRPSWWAPAFVGIIIAARLVLAAFGITGTLAAGLSAGIGVAIGQVTLLRNQVLARVGPDLVLVSTHTWTAKPKAIEKRMANPHMSVVREGFMSSKVTVDGVPYSVSNAALKVFDQIARGA